MIIHELTGGIELRGSFDTGGELSYKNNLTVMHSSAASSWHVKCGAMVVVGANEV